MILGGEINDAKMGSFSADFQTLIKHQFYFYFLYELLMSLRSDHTAQWSKTNIPINIYILLDSLVCSIMGYFYESRHILWGP